MSTSIVYNGMMDNITDKFEKCGIEIPEILLPREIDLRQWAVIACDQFTQDKLYWEKAKEAAAGSPSTLNLIFPEVFLGGTGGAQRIDSIHQNMRDYLAKGVFSAPRRGFVYIERDTPCNKGRRGLVAAVDLEQYSWAPEARPLIRSTEGTIAERLPPRMDIRRNAPLETPHILLLIDDETDTLLQGVGERAKKAGAAPAYQGELMLNSGSINAWFADEPETWDFLAGGLENLARRALTRYTAESAPGEKPFLFAVGDGNHSLATAKGIWEEYKKAHGVVTHPCRYALVEIENIYDPAIAFEPIHRVVFGMGFDEAIRLFSALPGFSSRIIANRGELTRLTAEPVKGNRFGIISGNKLALLETSAGGISTASLQPLLDGALGNDNALSIDYIHGEDELFRLASGPETVSPRVVSILLPPVQKAGFFETVARHGPLPRKSFSMGEADEKRFYIECRQLF